VQPGAVAPAARAPARRGVFVYLFVICARDAQVKVSDIEYAFVKVFQPLPYTGKPPEARLGGVHLRWWCVCR
jgi:hypothetical protein